MSIYRFIILFLSLSITALSSANETLPIEIYGALPEVSMMVISPSGEKIAYRRTEQEKDYMVIYNLADNKLLGAMDLSNIKPSDVYFIDEKKLIIVVKRNNRLWGYRGRHEISSAYAYDLEKNKMVQLLTLGSGIHDGQTQLGNIVGLSADGDSVYMPAWANATSFSLMRASLERRKVKQFKRGNRDVIDYFVNDQDTILARVLYNNKLDLHSIEALTDGKWHQIFSEKTIFPTKSFVGLTPDFKHLIMLDKNANTGHIAYYTMRLKDGKISNAIFSKSNKSVESVLTDINRVVYGVRYAGFKPSYELFNQKTHNLVASIIQSMPNNSLRLVNHTPDWSKMIFLIEGEHAKGDYFIYANGKFSSVGSQRSRIAPTQVHQVYETEFKARDGLKIPLLLTLPNIELKALPAILMPHGGPESYDRVGFDWMAQFFASRGFLVIQPQFRGSDGFGSDFILKGRGEWGQKMQHDLTDAVKTLIKSDYVNPNKVCIVGASYGGYAALAGAAFTPELYQCAVSINGVADVKRMLKDEKNEYGSDHWVLAYWQESIINGTTANNHLKKISPITHINNIKIPILLIHGEYDEVVPIRQSENMYEELKDAGKPVEFITLEKGDHHLSKGGNRMKALKAIDNFIMSAIGVN
ncbi:S9 family peptidase [Colwellia sp. KU-HH00111]|uniref:alpha/beta hydrolase family protein n=1 Tax=Colwellia sp. KU-HH00111 TaxID=3127652 RepID=UPI003102E150